MGTNDERELQVWLWDSCEVYTEKKRGGEDLGVKGQARFP